MTENVILKKLCTDTEYFSNVFSMLKDSDFDDKTYNNVFKTIQHLYSKYSKSPNLNEIELFYQSTGLSEEKREEHLNVLSAIKQQEIDIKKEILVDYTESWLKLNRFRRDVLVPGMGLLDGSDRKVTLESLQKTSEEINKITFQKSSGLDYIKDAESNFLEYSKVEDKGIIPNLEIVRTATGNIGARPGDLGLYLAESNSGKTMALINETTNALLQGKNVVYISMEEDELEGVRSRVDSNLMGKTNAELRDQGLNLRSTFNNLVKQGIGKLKIISYGPMSANCLNYESQLKEWELQDGFKPDLIVHDSVTITAPINKGSDSSNLYTLGKEVSEELKALSVKVRAPVISACQTGKQAYGANSITMSDVSTSIAIIQVASYVIGIALDEKRPDIRIMNIVKSRKVNKDKIKPSIVNCNTELQRLSDFTTDEKRAYIKKDAKEQLHTYDELAKVAEKVQTGEIKEEDIENDENILSSFLN